MPTKTPPTRYAVTWKGTPKQAGSGKYDESKHARGGKPENKGEFSATPGAGLRSAAKNQPTSSNIAKTAGSAASPAADPAAAHAFTKGQLGSIPEPLRGLMSALHAHPDTQSTGTVHAPDVAPNQARQVYEHLRQSAVQTVGGRAQVGQAVDLGGGKLGYSSPAGAIVISPPDSSGKHQVKYTNQTGVVQRAMGGQPGSPPGSASGAPPTAQPPGSQPAATMATTPGEPPVIAGQPAQPGFEPSKATPEQNAAAAALIEKPAGPAKPSDPRQAANDAKGRLEAATSKWQDEVAGGLTPKGNARWRSYTAALRSIWTQHEQLARDWEKKSKAGEKPEPGSKSPAKPSAAPESQHSPEESVAHKNAPEAFKELQAMRASGGEDFYQDAVKQLAGQGKPWERRSAVGAPTQAKKPTDSASPAAKPKEKPREITQDERNPPIAGKTQPEQWRNAGEAFKPKPKPEDKGDTTGLTQMGGGMAGGIAGNMHEMLWGKVQKGDTTEGGAPSALLQVAKAARQKGGVTTPEHMKALAQEFGHLKKKGLTGPAYQQALHQLVAKHSGESKEAAAMAKPAAKQESAPPFINDWPKAPEAKEAPQFDPDTDMPIKKADERGAMARRGIDPKSGKPTPKPKPAPSTKFETPPVEQPKSSPQPSPKEDKGLEGSAQWKALVRKKSSEWDMKTHDFHELAGDLHKELVEHHGERKSAYLAASKSTGLKPADINKLENQGYDSGSEHKKIRQLDTIGRELAAEYPGLGWGRGREGDDDEADTDYAENVWALIREGYKPPPGKHSQEFMDHVEDFLRSQLKSAGSSGVAGGHAAEGDGLSAVPFSKVRRGIVQRYRKWLDDSNHRLTLSAATP